MKRLLSVLSLSLLLSACTTSGAGPESREERRALANERLEHLNRQVFEFNEMLDRLVLKPVAQGYERVTPAPLNRGVSHFFANIAELPSALNAVLQGKPAVAADNLFRFMINSTFGMLGFIDVASEAGIPDQKEDFGQTLAVWGAPAGPYLVLPFFGPSTFRDAHGRLGDSVADPLNRIEHWAPYVATRTADIVDARADLLKAEELVTGDRYSFLKNAYLQNREYLVHDGQVEDTFEVIEFDEEDDWLED